MFCEVSANFKHINTWTCLSDLSVMDKTKKIIKKIFISLSLSLSLSLFLSFSLSLSLATYIYEHVYECACVCENGLKNSYDVADFLNQRCPRTVTPMKDVNGLQRGRGWKINLIWSHYMRVTWSVYDHFSQSSCIYIYI